MTKTVAINENTGESFVLVVEGDRVTYLEASEQYVVKAHKVEGLFEGS